MVLHQSGVFHVEHNPEPKLCKGVNGFEYFDNYLVVHAQHEVVQARTEDYLSALSLCEYFASSIQNRRYLRDQEVPNFLTSSEKGNLN